MDKYGRDPGITDIVMFFDQPEKCGWHLLSDSEAKILHTEIARCQDPISGFGYMARNYYWITTKGSSDTLLKFTETQELFYETIKHIKQTERGQQRGVRLLIIKGRQLYCTSFFACYLAWLTQVNVNNRGLIVSYREDHAAKLFSIVLHIYDKLPWWLRPMIGPRKYESEIHLINPEPELRYFEPGLNSKIMVQAATQNVGIAEGETVNAALLSEFGSWDQDKARKIINADFRWALPDMPNTFAVLETRVRQASKFCERLWESNVKLGEMADWYPLFLPIYFDKTHFIAPRPGWKPEAPELAIKERAQSEWCECSNCKQIRPANFGGVEVAGTDCSFCKTGMYAPYLLQDGQMRWLYERRLNAEGLGDAAMIEMQQSLATNPQEAFASVTNTIFSKQARDWVATTTRHGCMAQGYMASDGVFHGPRRLHGQESAQCWSRGCAQDHRGETDRYLKVWEPPVRGVRYSIGVDPAQGLGGNRDYSVVWVNKIGQVPNPDVQVAIYRCNTISTWHLADLVNALGRWYNNALVTCDYQPPTTADRLLNHYNYPNIYRWINPDAQNQHTTRYHWLWNYKNKESSWQTLDGWLRDHSLVARDEVFAEEMRHFQRLPDNSVGAPQDTDEDSMTVHDDTVSAAMLALIPPHQRDPRRPAEAVVPQSNGLRGPGEWVGACTKCEKTFDAQAPQERDHCPFCGSIWLKWKMPKMERPVGVGPNAILGFKFDDMGGMPGTVRDRYGASEEFSFGYAQGGME